jgi:hypothetical protein
MFGFFGLMAVLLALIALVSYWISWDLQPKESRSPFAATAWHDLGALLAKYRGVVRNREKRWRHALDAYAKQDPRTETVSILQRSDPS